MTFEPDRRSALPMLLNGRFHTATYCTASQFFQWAGMPAGASAATDAIRLPMRRVYAETTLIHEGQTFDGLYLVVSGSFKCVQTDAEGYEQVLDFAIHGDFLGLDGLGQDHHMTAAVALEDAMVVVVPLHQFPEPDTDAPGLSTLLLRATGAGVVRRGATHYLMSAARSEVRVARFLLHMAQRQGAIGYSERRLRLTMTRRDIASYLGVAHETISRALGSLVSGGCITVSHRDIEIIDFPKLNQLQRMTRGRPADEPEGAAEECAHRQAVGGQPLWRADVQRPARAATEQSVSPIKERMAA